METLTPDDPFWTDTWHGCVWAAFVEAARACGGMPAGEDVRVRAYRMYEQELAARNAARDRDDRFQPDPS
ncbi:MAG: hypothetical protein K2V38_10870 [Gemmataceae bacterium]|nr:hypothetical protein [Gemmataceae bacterium]